MTMRQRLCSCCLVLLCACALQAAQTPVPESLRDLARLKQDTNSARLEALKEILRVHDIPFELQSFQSPPSPHGRTQGTNLVMSFGTGEKEIAVGAHYDAVESREGGLIGGMVDNGSAVIILTRLAEALKNQTLRHRVRVVFFDMEEEGLYGSRAYVASHKPEIAAAINLDIAGMGSTLAYALGKAEGTTYIQKAIGMACSELQHTCMEFPSFPPSDDRTFQAANLPVVSIAAIPPLQSLMQIQSLMKFLHTPDDNLDKIEPASLDPVVRVLLKTVLKLDETLD
jgi:Zn-dependent M28 family amino/carboxypeptidase